MLRTTSPRARLLRADAAGFTLLELLVVLAIIAVLASFVAPTLFHHVADARQTTADTQIESLGLALSNFQLDTGRYPSAGEGLDALRARPASLADGVKWRGPYIQKVLPLDPWGRPYVYRSPGLSNPSTFDLYSLGRDGRVGGTGEDDDVTSWGGPVQP